MFKIIVPILFIASVFAQQSPFELSSEELKLFEKLEGPQSQGQDEITIKPKRFTYTENNFATQKFTAVLKANSPIQNLDGTRYYTTSEARVLKVEEVSPGSPFTFVFNKKGEAVFICYSRDLERLNEKVALTPPKIKFEKVEDNFKSIDNDQKLLLNLLISTGNHQYDIFEESESLSSLGFTTEVGLESSRSIPMMIVTSFNQVSGSNFKWTFANLGLKLSHFWKWNQRTNIGLFLQAERSLYGKANLAESSISLHENRFSIGSSVHWNDKIFSLEVAKERLIFPNDILLNSNNIRNTNVYHTSFIFKAGKQFEINL